MIVKDGKSKYPSLLRVCKNEQENQAYIRKTIKLSNILDKIQWFLSSIFEKNAKNPHFLI